MSLHVYDGIKGCKRNGRGAYATTLLISERYGWEGFWVLHMKSNRNLGDNLSGFVA